MPTVAARPALLGVVLGALAAGPAAADCLFLTDGTVIEAARFRTEGDWIKYDLSPTVTIGVPRSEVQRMGPCPAAPPRYVLVRAESFPEGPPAALRRGIRVHVVPEDWSRADEIALLIARDWPGVPALRVLFWDAAEDVGPGPSRYAVEVRGGAVTRVLRDGR